MWPLGLSENKISKNFLQCQAHGKHLKNDNYCYHLFQLFSPLQKTIGNVLISKTVLSEKDGMLSHQLFTHIHTHTISLSLNWPCFENPSPDGGLPFPWGSGEGVWVATGPTLTFREASPRLGRGQQLLLHTRSRLRRPSSESRWEAAIPASWLPWKVKERCD